MAGIMDRRDFLKGFGGVVVGGPAIWKLLKRIPAEERPDLPIPVPDGSQIRVFAASAASAGLLSPSLAVNVGYRRALEAFDEDLFPTLRAAERNSAPANHVKIEWLDRRGRPEFNYTQIFRT